MGDNSEFKENADFSVTGNSIIKNTSGYDFNNTRSNIKDETYGKITPLMPLVEKS